METIVTTVQSTFDETQLHVLIAKPQGEAKAIIQIAHGMCEYIERYEGMMEFFTARGYVVAGNDHRGHKGSVKDDADLGYFYDKTGTAIVEDMVAVTKHLKELYPGLPVYLFGHSMGSMVARCYMQTHEELIDKVVLCGAPAKNALAGLAIFLTDVVTLFCGDRHLSKLLFALSLGPAEKQFAAEGSTSWLSKNQENVKDYLADDYCGFMFTTNGFRNLFCLLKKTYEKKRYALQKPNMPVYFMAGADDPIIVSPKAWEEEMAFLRGVGYTDVSGKLYEGLRHELLKEKESEQIMEELLVFLEK